MSEKIKTKDKATEASTIKIAAFKKHIRKTNPHTHNNYLELLYLTKGVGSHTINTHTFEITPPVLYVIKEQDLHFWDIHTEPDGFVLILKKAFVDQHTDYELGYLIAQLKVRPYWKISPENTRTVQALFELLITEKSDTGRPGATLLNLLKALISKLLSDQSLPRPAHRDLCSRFTELLSYPDRLVNSVAHYAQLLHTTPQNLNAACKKHTGNTAYFILAHHITEEAKRLLLYTELSISEIAYKLGFKDNSHFSKYFRKNTGRTPSALKKTG